MIQSNFYQDANNPEKVIDNYLYRSEWHNKIIWKQCRDANQKFLMIGENTEPDEIVASIYGMIINTV